MLLLIELGRRLGQRRLARNLEGDRAGLGAVEGAVFGLLGLLIACPAESVIASPVRPPGMNIRRAWRVGY